MRVELWIAWKLLWSRKTLFGGSAPLALLGLILGVASLVASMAVMSGFEASLRQAMSDVTGHVLVHKRSPVPDDPEVLLNQIRQNEPDLVGGVRFLRLEALLARQGQILGVMAQAVDRETWTSVLDFSSRLKAGELSLEPQGDFPGVLIGTGLARKFSLKPGDRFRLVMPIADSLDPERFSRKLGEFVVRGVVDLGKYDWNERFLLMDLKAAQEFAVIGDRYNGFLLRFPTPERGLEASFALSQVLGGAYSVTDWRETNLNLFEAVRLERVVIFFVVSIIVLVAAFTVASTLFVNVVRRTDDIGILKSLGLPRASLLRVFSFQGLFLGLAGLVGGALVGALLCEGFSFLQSHFSVVAGSVYKVEGIRLSLRWQDVLAISGMTLGICVVSTFAPAWRGAQLSPVEGIRHG